MKGGKSGRKRQGGHRGPKKLADGTRQWSDAPKKGEKQKSFGGSKSAESPDEKLRDRKRI